jgi:subtilisin family serine protease
LLVTVAPGAHTGLLPAGTVVRRVDERTVAVLATPDDRARLAASPATVSVRPDPVMRAAVTPNDPCWSSCVFGDQWGAQAVRAGLAWDVTTGSPSVTVAMIDSGVDTTHLDLQGRVQPIGAQVDDCGHGTEVAGVLAAAGDNGRGIAGMAWNARILSYKVLSGGPANCTASLSDVAAAVRSAATAGARVINLSLEGNDDDPALHSAVDFAAQRGALVVAAAGNDRNSVPRYPAAYDNVVGVASVSENLTRSSFSSYGSWVDIAAPGQDILTTSLANGYSEVSGTSFSAPFVSGAAALVWSQAPTLTANQVRARLLFLARPAGAGLGTGVLDAAAAVRVLPGGAAACRTTVSGWMLDGWGGIHTTGSAPSPGRGAPYWPNWDIARDLTASTGGGAYVLDGWGGVHPVGNAPALRRAPYWPNWDIARGVAARPDGKGVYVLDGWGGVHAVGATAAPLPASPASTYWPNWDIARDITLDPADASRGWVLDGWGGLHPFGGAPAAHVTGYHPGADLARTIVLAPGGAGGYILDASGLLWPFTIDGRDAPPDRISADVPLAVSRAAAFDSTGDLALVTGDGAVVPGAGAPCTPQPTWPGWDITRSFVSTN